MNLDSYIRLNPYSEDEKGDTAQARKVPHLSLIAWLVLALVVVGVSAWVACDVTDVGSGLQVFPVTNVPALADC
jgi:hypothetical protein